MPRKSARSAGPVLVSDLSDESFGSFLRLLGKRGKLGVDGVAELTRQQYTNVCSALEQQVQAALLVVFPELDAGQEQEQHATYDVEGAILVLYGAALLSHELLMRSQQQPCDALVNTARMLHDYVLMNNLCPELESLVIDLQDAALKLCCSWWERRAVDKEFLITRAIPYLLCRAVQGLHKPKTSFIKLCYSMRDAMELLEWDDETIKDTKSLLLFAAFHPAFLRESEGRRFVAWCFRLEPQMTNELFAIIRNQIPSNQPATLAAYGEILFRAWRDTVGPCAAEVESEIQTLMQAAITASTASLAKAIRSVLNGLHSQKNLEKRINPALVRLYDPILPRAFAAANAEVRRNAVNLLAAAFPIVDPEAGAAENNTRMTHQLGLFLESLGDACPSVREAAVESCCRCLKFFWEIIPAATSAKMIGDMTGKLAFDGSSRDVRIAVLRGMRSLLDSQHALPVLKKALPGLADLLCDSDPKVRDALADLLVGVGTCRGLPISSVVSLEHLLETLAVDANPEVAGKIARILVPSYFPNAQEGAARLGALLRSKPEAGLAFCRHLVARFLPSNPRVKNGGKGKVEFTASVPLEQILQLFGDLFSHLLTSGAGLGQAAAAAQQQPANKRAKSAAKQRGGKGAGGQEAPVRKKRAKKKAAGSPNDLDDDDGADQQGADNNDTPDASGAQPASAVSDEEVLQDAITETEEGWLAILEGLVQVAEGICAAVANTEECSAADVGAVLSSEDSLVQLLSTAEDTLRKPKAVKLVLKLVASLYFTSAARSVRAVLFDRLAQGTLSGLRAGGGDDAMEIDGSASSQHRDVGLLVEFLKALAAGCTGPKLAAMLAAALGVREPQPIRKPAAPKKASKAGKGDRDACCNGEGRDLLDQILGGGDVGKAGHGKEEGCDADNVVCVACKRPEPADTLLLCDGCDVGCHTHCLRPALQEIPETDWFCWQCETQLQHVQLLAADAGRCVGLLLQLEEGRALLCDHPDFGGMVQAMHQLAIEEADAINSMAQEGAADEADSAPAAGTACSADNADDRALHLGDPWGALSRYCRAALHRAMWTARPRTEAIEAPEAPSVQPTPASAGRDRRKKKAVAETPAASERGRSQMPTEDGGDEDALLQGFYEIVPVIDYAVQTCAQLASLVVEGQSLAAHLAALQYSHDLLRVLHFVQSNDLMNMSAEYVGTIAGLCSTQAGLVHAAATALASQGGGSQQQQACVSCSLQVVLLLAQQLAEAVRKGASEDAPDSSANGGAMTPGPAFGRRRKAAADGDAGEDADELPSQQLQARMEAVRDERDAQEDTEGQEVADVEEPPAPDVSVGRLAEVLVALLCDAAVADLLKGAVRNGAADLINELLTLTKEVAPGGWLDTLSTATGMTLTHDPRVTSELDDILQPQAAGNNDGVEGNDQAGGADADDGASDVQRPGRAGGKKAAAAAMSAKEKAQKEQATKLSELLQRESPAVGTMATVLVRVCVARKAHGRAMLLLAPLASRWLTADANGATEGAVQQQEDGGEEDAAAKAAISSLGAAVLLTLCRAEEPAAGMAQTLQPAARRRAGGAPVQDAAAQAEHAQGLGVLRRAVQQGGTPQQEQQDQPEGEDGAATGLRQVQGLARLLVQQLAGGPVAASS
ncbi:hypothetical protein Agub_g4576 [Astrephomene gubernaculifera]|uniref:PHD-type domain-containing protein n=1 Tax=Astrephomene gubernaculifera TaxID=47775 RepID=A0AAD3HKA9_9CHLO|nr:hypothetical protein Agub_g4576 [Astrephomene gubernaculifera]